MINSPSPQTAHPTESVTKSQGKFFGYKSVFPSPPVEYEIGKSGSSPSARLIWNNNAQIYGMEKTHLTQIAHWVNVITFVGRSHKTPILWSASSMGHHL